MDRIGDFGWTSDACPRCGAEDAAEGCAAVLPVALMVDDSETIVLAYRCRHGHDWTTSWDRTFALGHAEASQHQLGGLGAPHWPDVPTS